MKSRKKLRKNSNRKKNKINRKTIRKPSRKIYKKSGKQKMTIRFQFPFEKNIFFHPLYCSIRMVKYLNHVKKVLHVSTQLGNMKNVS